MSLLGAILMILTGLAIMSHGLFLFYFWLPLLYAIVGFDIGMLLGRWITGDYGLTAFVLAVVGAVILAGASYFLEPYRRILLGVSGGVLVGVALAAALNFETMLGAFVSRLLVLVCGIAGGLIVPRYFNAFVVASTAFSGAVLTMAGLNFFLPGALFDLQGGAVLPALIGVALAIAGIIWQSRNIASWVKMMPSQA
jgi:hypothetical protein